MVSFLELATMSLATFISPVFVLPSLVQLIDYHTTEPAVASAQQNIKVHLESKQFASHPTSCAPRELPHHSTYPATIHLPLHTIQQNPQSCEIKRWPSSPPRNLKSAIFSTVYAHSTF